MTKPNVMDKQTMVVDIRQLVEPDEAEYYLLCLNQNTWLIIQMLHSFYAGWRNRYSQNVDIEEPLQPDDTEWKKILKIFNQGEMELTQVTCLTDLTDAINALTTALIEKEMAPTINTDCGGCGGCGGCSGGNGNTTDDQPAVGQPPVPGPGPGGLEPPESWEGTAEEYNLYKCKAANFIYEACYNALNYMAAASASITAVGGGVAAGSSILTGLLSSGAAYTAAGGVMLFAFVPGWVIGAIVAAVAVVAFVAGWAVLEVASWVAEEFETGKDDLICELYNSPDIETARGHLELALADAVANMVIDAPFSAWESLVRSAYAEVVGWFVPNSLLNVLFEEDRSVVSYSGGSNDCTSCDVSWWNCIFGTPENTTTFSVDIVAVIALDGDYSANIGVEGLPETWNITVIDGEITTPLAVPESVTRWSDLEGAACGVASVDPQWNEVLGVEQTGLYPSITAYALRSSTPFTIKIERS